MGKKVRSSRGVFVDFDLLKIKEQIAAAPATTDVRARQDFIEKKLRRRMKAAANLTVTKETVEVAPRVLSTEFKAEPIAPLKRATEIKVEEPAPTVPHDEQPKKRRQRARPLTPPSAEPQNILPES